MDLDFKIYPVDDNHIYIIFEGKAYGLIEFNDYDLFASFFERFYNFFQEHGKIEPIESDLPQHTLPASV